MRLAVVSTPGVHLIVKRGPALGIIPDQEIQNLRVAIAAERVIEPHPFCQIGQRVEIIAGALQGLQGILVRQKGLCRVILTVQMLAKSVAVEVDLAEIVPVPEPSPAGKPIRPLCTAAQKIGAGHPHGDRPGLFAAPTIHGADCAVRGRLLRQVDVDQRRFQ
jgi:hypothetical protein